MRERDCDFEIEGTEAVMRRDGDRLLIEPVRKGRLLDLLARLTPLPGELPEVDTTLGPLDEVESYGDAPVSARHACRFARREVPARRGGRRVAHGRFRFMMTWDGVACPSTGIGRYAATANV